MPEPRSGEPLFLFDDVVLDGDDRPRLDRLTLEIPDQGTTAVVGASGSGKSSLLRLCNRLEVPDAGHVSLRGTLVDCLDPLELRRAVGMVMQRPVAFPGTVRDNLLAAHPSEESDRALCVAIDRVGLASEMLDRSAHELSGGELQRMCLARTLLTEPSVLLADEPTASIDDDSGALVEAAVGALVERGLRVLWVTHDRAQAERVGDRTIELSDGRLISGGASP